MEKLTRVLLCGLLYFFTTAIISCAPVTRQSVVRTQADHARVWKASIEAINDIGYAVSSTDPTTGLIVAEQDYVLSSGHRLKLNVLVSRSENGRQVSITHVQPGDYLRVGVEEPLAAYVKALTKRIPDVEVIQAKQ